MKVRIYLSQREVPADWGERMETIYGDEKMPHKIELPVDKWPSRKQVMKDVLEFGQRSSQRLDKFEQETVEISRTPAGGLAYLFEAQVVMLSVATP